MSEGRIAALLKPADTSIFETVEQFIKGNAEAFERQKCSKTIVELSGLTFDSWIEDKVDEFVDGLTDESFVRLLFHDEYGTEIFWVINDGVSRKFRHDFDEVSKRVVKAYEALHEGLGRVRKGTLTKAEVAEMKKETSDPRTRQYMDVIFFPPVAKPLESLEFEGYLQPHGFHSDAKSSYAHWFPISRKKANPPEALIDQLLEKTGRSFYAKTYRDGSRTQRILHCSPVGITELYNTDDYTDDELRYVQAHTEDTRNGELEWTHFHLGFIEDFLEKPTLREFVEERVAAYRAEIAEDQRKLAELMAAHPDDREPLLDGVGLYLWYVDEDVESARALARMLQVKGMKKDEVEKMYHLGKKKRVRVSGQLKSAGKWLVDNVEALHDYEVDVEDEDDENFIVIHMT